MLNVVTPEEYTYPPFTDFIESIAQLLNNPDLPSSFGFIIGALCTTIYNHLLEKGINLADVQEELIISILERNGFTKYIVYSNQLQEMIKLSSSNSQPQVEN